MLDWEDLRHFAALGEAGTLAGAARMLRVEHATVARRVAALEAQLGVKLVDRRGRRIELTAIGVRIATRLDDIRERMIGIERVAASDREELAGTVTLSAPPALAAALLGPILAGVRDEYPGIDFLVLGESRASSLDRREADLAIRLGRPLEGELIIRKIGEVVFRPYAHPDYVGDVPEQERSFIGYTGPLDDSPQQHALRGAAAGRPIVARASMIEMQAALAEAKVGIALLPEFLTRGRCLVPTDGVLLSREVWLLMHADLRDSAPVRAVGVRLAEDLAHALRAPDA